METYPAGDRPPVVVVDVSSDEGSPPIVVSNDDFDWLGELLYEEAVEGLAEEQQDDDDDDVVVIGESSPLDKSRKRKLEGRSDRDRVDDEEDDGDECLVLDGDPDKSAAAMEGNKGSVGGSDSEELLVVGEKGQVACRDYPHPRHDCVNFPFKTTPHVKHCDLCHCYVCDLPAPCIYWGTGMSNSDHCHATDKDGDWKIRRKDLKSGKSAGQVAFVVDNGISEIAVPLPPQTPHNGQIPSAASSTQQNLLSRHTTAYQMAQALFPGRTPIPTNGMPQNLPPLPAIYHRPRKSPADIFPPRLPVLQRCSSSMEDHSSSNISSGLRKQKSVNFKVCPPSHYPPGERHVRSSIRPQHASSVPRFNKMEIGYHPSVSRAGCVSNNASCVPQLQFRSKFRRSTAINDGHNQISGRNSQLCTAFPSDMRNGHLSAAGASPNIVHTQSAGFGHPSSGMSLDAWYASDTYQPIDGAGALNQSAHAPHQNQGAPLRPEAEPTDPDRNLPQEFDFCRMTVNNNWWSESDLPHGQFSVEPPPPSATVNMGALLFDFETPWNGGTGS